MAFTNNISSAIAQYVYNQSNGAVIEPIGGSYIQAYCEYLGATTLIDNSWLITLCNHFGITAPLNGSWTIALANYYGITYPCGGTWWMCLSEAAAPVTSFIWNEVTTQWQDEIRMWKSVISWDMITTEWQNETTQWQTEIV